VPSAPVAYVHRIGRVGRAGREGVAITLAEPREHRMLKAIERHTRQRIAVEKVPTVADLRARRLELTRAALEESLLADDLERFRVVVETLAGEHDVMEVALAAVKLAHEATGTGNGEDDEHDIPDLTAPRSARETRGPIRPKDLVGAITGESSLSGRDIGAIEIADRFSIVEVPDTAVDAVITALRGTKIKGNRPTIRRDRGHR
jgi:ATP-dependent RNA helicase DeaD